MQHINITGCFLIFFLSACAGSPQTGQTPKPRPVAATSGHELPLDNSNVTLKATLQAKIATVFRLLESHNASETAPSEDIYGQNLPISDNDYTNLAQAAMALQNNKIKVAKYWLGATSAKVTKSLAYNLTILRSNFFALLGNYKVALTTLVHIMDDDDLSKQDKIGLYPLFWEYLLLADKESNANLWAQVDLETRAWLRLAHIVRTLEPLPVKLAAIQNWEKQWQPITKVNFFPEEAKIQRIIAARPKNIALLIPKSGHLAASGKTVQEGFLAAYFSSQKLLPHLQIIIYDSTQPLNQQITKAKDQGAEFIVAYLRPEQVYHIASLTLDVPVLVLGQGDYPKIEGHANFFQYNLNPDDQARQITQKAWQDGIKNPIILTPDNQQGRRISDALRQNWTELDGTVVENASYKDRSLFKTLIATIMQVKQSKMRARKIQRLSGQKLQFTPRRRQDIDAIFLDADTTDGRLLKPMLAYQFAGNLPVYAFSRIYQGTPSPNQDRDLNKIYFPLAPWFTTQSLVKQQIQVTTHDANSEKGLLYALGADAWQICAYAQTLVQRPGMIFFGYTGRLQMDPQGLIHRSAPWRQFKRGRPQPIFVRKRLASTL